MTDSSSDSVSSCSIMLTFSHKCEQSSGLQLCRDISEIIPGVAVNPFPSISYSEHPKQALDALCQLGTWQHTFLERYTFCTLCVQGEDEIEVVA